jgi:hypothetical protein
MVSWDSMASSWVLYFAMQYIAYALRTQAHGEADRWLGVELPQQAFDGPAAISSGRLPDRFDLTRLVLLRDVPGHLGG